MRIKLDENLPLRLVLILGRLGHETDTVPQEGLQGRMTLTSGKRQTGGRFFITQDLDFSHARRIVPGTHHGILLARLRDPGRNALVKRVQSLFQSEHVEVWKQGFVVATDHKIQVRLPKPQNDPDKG